jgi:hypothetical protein
MINHYLNSQEHFDHFLRGEGRLLLQGNFRWDLWMNGRKGVGIMEETLIIIINLHEIPLLIGGCSQNG